jgi:hypothetical protein
VAIRGWAPFAEALAGMPCVRCLDASHMIVSGDIRNPQALATCLAKATGLIRLDINLRSQPYCLLEQMSGSGRAPGIAGTSTGCAARPGAPGHVSLWQQGSGAAHWQLEKPDSPRSQRREPCQRRARDCTPVRQASLGRDRPFVASLLPQPSQHSPSGRRAHVQRQSRRRLPRALG